MWRDNILVRRDSSKFCIMEGSLSPPLVETLRILKDPLIDSKDFSKFYNYFIKNYKVLVDF